MMIAARIIIFITNMSMMSLSTSTVASTAVQRRASPRRAISIRIFEDDDAGYLAWVERNQHGFVVNTFRKPDPRYLMLHRGRCGTIRGKPARRALDDFLELGYLPLLGKVIRANRERFAGIFESIGQTEAHLNPLFGLRNTLAHTKEAQIAERVRRSGETEVRWFGEKLGVEFEVVAPPSL